MADALRAKEQQRLEAKQAEWATKKWMWIVDAREGCIPAYIVKEAGEDVTLKLNDGSVRRIDRANERTNERKRVAEADSARARKSTHVDPRV